VTQSIDDATSKQTQSPALAARWAGAVLILATLYLCYFHNLGAIGLVGPDEPRYAWIARDMAESGDWITPRLYGKPWFEKPPLYYWSAALSFKLFGVGETTARLPSAIYALLATLAMAWLAWRIYGAETARWLLLLLPTTMAMIAFSHAAATDMPFAATLTIAMVFAAQLLGLNTAQRDGGRVPRPASLAWRTHDSLGAHDFNRAEKPLNEGALAPEVSDSPLPAIHRSNIPSAIFFGFFLGLAVIAKGPAAIILSGGAVFFWATITKRWREAVRCLHPLAITAFCATALPWYILCARRNPDFLRVFIIEHNFKRFLTPEFQHIQPFWYYAGILLIAFLPWTLLLLYTVIRGALNLWRTRTMFQATLFLLCWPLFVVIFFSVSKSKLPGYILPAIPAIGLLMVRGYLHAINRNEKSFRWLLISAASPVLIASLLIWLVRLGDQLFIVALDLSLFAIANLLLGLPTTRPHSRAPLSAVSVIPILLLICFYPRLQSALFPFDPSGKTLAADLTLHNIAPENLFAGHMPRGQQYSLGFYLHREVASWITDPKEGYLLSTRRNCKELVGEQWSCSTEPLYLERSGYLLYHVTAPQ
jgi:4-amino-4-deoxy-L-arabinose transferase-like glycosyltransferase